MPGGKALGSGLVDGVEAEAGVLLAEAAGEEEDGGHGGGDAAAEGAHRVLAHFVGRGALGGLGAGGGHRGLEQAALQKHSVSGQGFVDGAQHPFLHRGGGGDVVVAIHQDLGLHDGHEALLLHGAGVAGQAPGVLAHRQFAGAAIAADAQHGAPFGKAGASGVIAFRPLRQAAQAGAPGFARQPAGEGFNPLVDLDARHDPLLLEELHNRRPLATIRRRAGLEKGFLVEDRAADRHRQPRGGGQQGAVGAAVGLAVLQRDRLEALANGGGGFIGGQQAGAGRRQGRSGGGQFVAVGVEGHGGGASSPHWHGREDVGAWPQRG